MPRRWCCLALLFLLPACSDRAAPARPAPAQQAERPAKQPVEARAPDRRKQIEQALIEAQAFGERHAGKHAAVIERWQGLVAQAVGGEYQDYVAEQIALAVARRDAAAEQAYGRTAGAASHWAGSDDWARCFAVLDRYPPALLPTPAGRRLARLRKGYLARRRAAEQVSYKYVADFSWPRVRLGPGVRIEQERDLAHVPFDDYHILKFIANQTSLLRLVVELERTAGAKLRITHLTAWTEGDPRSPITVTVNGKVLVGDWYPRSENFVTTVWDIERYVRPGKNVIEWTLGDATTHYWLRKFQISDWK